MKLAELNSKQRHEIFESAVEATLESCLNDPAYLKSLIRNFISRLPPIQQLNMISSDPDIWVDLISFNPETGKPWDLEVAIPEEE